MEKVILRPAQVIEAGYIGSRTSLFRAVKERDFPKPVKLGPNRIGFIRAELDAWIERQRAGGEAA